MSMSKEKSQILEIVCKDGWELQNLEDQWKSDKEVVLAAVGNLGHALEFADVRLKKDKEVVLAAIMSPKNGEATLIITSDYPTLILHSQTTSTTLSLITSADETLKLFP